MFRPLLGSRQFKQKLHDSACELMLSVGMVRRVRRLQRHVAATATDVLPWIRHVHNENVMILLITETSF